MFSCLQINDQPFYFRQLLKFYPFEWLIEIYLQTEGQGTHHKMASLQSMPGFSPLLGENQAHLIPSVDFVFADINCHLTVRTKSGRFHHFNSQEQLLEILEDKFSEDDYSDD